MAQERMPGGAEDRRTFLKQALALGVAAPVLGALSGTGAATQSSAPVQHASDSRRLDLTATRRTTRGVLLSRFERAVEPASADLSG